ncbi:MAG: hypothetical protein JWO31_1613 [Phycisphaerales bacterium]|nr:hypothetical protein [Phycisphaerales bacterium]
MLTKTGTAVLLLFAAAGRADAGPGTTGPATRPGDAPAGAEAAADPEAAAGRAKARADLAAGVLAEVVPIPEALLLGWARPGSGDSNLFDYYRAVVADRYGVRTDWVMFHAGLAAPVAWAGGYNAEMGPAIEARSGRGVMARAWREACRTPSATRAKYLDDRKRGVGPPGGPAARGATRPADAPGAMNK